MIKQYSVFKQACTLLPKLTKEEREQLRQRIQFLNNSSPTPPVEPTNQISNDWLLTGIEEELRRRGVLGKNTHIAITRLNSNWPTISREAREAISNAIGKTPTRVAYNAVGVLAARSLALYLANAKVPVSPKTMVNNIDKVLIALDQQFPGYVEAGLLYCCIDQRLIG